MKFDVTFNAKGIELLRKVVDHLAEANKHNEEAKRLLITIVESPESVLQLTKSTSDVLPSEVERRTAGGTDDAVSG
jgi:hypothetical protein